jgi:hypothetical protein
LEACKPRSTAGRAGGDALSAADRVPKAISNLTRIKHRSRIGMILDAFSPGFSSQSQWTLFKKVHDFSKSRFPDR